MTVATETAAKPNSESGDKPAETPAGETKPVEQKPAATTATDTPAQTPVSKDGAAPPQSKAPEKYTLAVPEGGRLDAHDIAIVEEVAREKGWSNEEAQAQLDEHAAFLDSHSEAFRAVTEADPIYGGKHLDDTKKFAGAALDKLRPKGTPRGDAFRGLLHKSGYGNNLEVVSFLADLGKLMAEDGTAGGGGASVESMDIATALYGPDKPAS